MKTNHGRVPRIFFAVPLVLAILVIATGSVLGGGGPPTRGTIERAIDPSGQIDPDLAPDFISAVGPDGEIVGYVAKEAILGLGPVATDADGRPSDLPIPVYGDDLQTVVGHFYPARGFVPIGTDLEAVPTIEVEVGPAEPR